MRSDVVLATLVASITACSAGRPAVDRDAAGLDAPLAPGTDAPVAPGEDGGPPPGTDAPAVALPFCSLGCTGASDCVTASPAYDADNYACDVGRCRYTGCTGDAECQATFSDTRYGCRDVGTGTPTCTLRCTTTSDCVTASPAYDADNYTCDAGTCRYLGCNDDDECRATFSDTRYVCREVEVVSPLPLPTAARNCVLGCASASDCVTASPAFDADNYECVGGSCRYTGCNGDAECQATFSDARYVCR